jgi:hypothetical protein
LASNPFVKRCYAWPCQDPKPELIALINLRLAILEKEFFGVVPMRNAVSIGTGTIASASYTVS